MKKKKYYHLLLERYTRGTKEMNRTHKTNTRSMAVIQSIHAYTLTMPIFTLRRDFFFRFSYLLTLMCPFSFDTVLLYLRRWQQNSTIIENIGSFRKIKKLNFINWFRNTFCHIHTHAHTHTQRYTPTYKMMTN